MSTKGIFGQPQTLGGWAAEGRNARDIWRPAENTWVGHGPRWYILTSSGIYYPFEAEHNWPDEGTVQTLCDLHNIEVFGEVK